MNAPTNSKHQSATSDHGTPPEIMEPMREVLGGIALDPCSNEAFNRELVKADTFYSVERNGFRQSWKGTAWLNPPGGYCDIYGVPSPRINGRQVRRPGDVNSPRAWFEQLVKFHHAGVVPAFGYEAFSIEQLQTLQTVQAPYPLITDFCICIPSKRIQHLRINADGELVRGSSPTHASAIVYGGPNVRKFKRLFSKLGATGSLR